MMKVNGCPIELLEPEILRVKVFEPLLLLGPERFAGVDVRIRVRGGGYTSQIYAIRQAIAKGIVAYYQKCTCGALEGSGLCVFEADDDPLAFGLSGIATMSGVRGELSAAYELRHGRTACVMQFPARRGAGSRAANCSTLGMSCGKWRDLWDYRDWCDMR